MKTSLTIVERIITELIPAEYNPRQITQKQYNDLEVSLSQFGIVDPLIINMNSERLNIIIGGHQRLPIWQVLGHTTIPCIELDLNLKREKELNIRLNKNTGEFDFDILANNFDIPDLLEFGFEEYELGIYSNVDLLDDSDFETNKPMNHDKTYGNNSTKCPSCGYEIKL